MLLNEHIEQVKRTERKIGYVLKKERIVNSSFYIVWNTPNFDYTEV